MRIARSAIANMLFVVACVQGVAGGLLAKGCLCAPNVKAVGSAVAFGMGAFVTAYIAIGVWARRRPRRAAVTAVLLEVALLALMGLPSVGTPLPAWGAEGVAVVLLVFVLVVAFRVPTPSRLDPSSSV